MMDITCWAILIQMESEKRDTLQNLSVVSRFVHSLQKRAQLKVFGIIDACLDYCEYLIRTQMHRSHDEATRGKKRKKELNRELAEALKLMEVDELINYFTTMVIQLHNLTYQVYHPPRVDNSSFLIAQAWSRSYSLRIWKRKKLRFDREKHVITAQKDKKVKNYDLGNYLLRRSRSKDYFILVLQAINSQPLDVNKSVHLGFDYKNTYDQWFRSIQQSVEYKQWEFFVDIMKKKKKVKQFMEDGPEMQKRSVMIIEPCMLQTTFFKAEDPNSKDGRLSKQSGNANNTESQPVQSDTKVTHEESQSSGFEVPTVLVNRTTSQPIDKEKVIEESFSHRLIHLKIEMKFNQLQLELQKQDESVKVAKKNINFAQIIRPDYDFQTINSTQGFSPVTLQQAQQNAIRAELYQSQDDPNHCKLFIKCKTISSLLFNSLVSAILTPESSSIVNRWIKEINMQIAFLSENSAILYQKHTPLSRLYRPRDFIFLRHVCQNNPHQITIIDCSIQQEFLFDKNGENCVRGKFKSVSKLVLGSTGISIVVDMTLLNGEQLKPQQNSQHIMGFVKGFIKGVQTFLQSSEPQSFEKSKFYSYETAPQLVQNRDESQEQPLDISLNSCIRPKKITSVTITRDDFYRPSQYSHGSPPEDSAKHYKSHIEGMRVSYEPPKMLSRNFLSEKLSFIRDTVEEDKYDWKLAIEPTWVTDWRADEEKGGLVYKYGGKEEREHLKKIIETLTRKTFNGKNVDNVSFPVDILYPESILETSLKSLSYAPALFMDNGSQTVMDQFKNTVLFGILTPLVSIRVEKSFDPLLGQTCQAQISSDCKGYAQQISNKPPTSALLLQSPQYEITALLRPKLKLLINSSEGETEGVYQVRMKNGTKISFTTPRKHLEGLVFGDRRLILEGQSYFWITEQNIVLQLDFESVSTFSPYRDKKDYFEGKVFQVTPEFMRQFEHQRRKPTDRQIQKTLERVSGHWTSHVIFGSQRIDLPEITLYQMCSEANALPSDSSYREDINELKRGKVDSAQTSKKQLEERQKQDRIFRMHHP